MEPKSMLIDSRSEINGFKTDPWGLLEALWGPLEAFGNTDVAPKAYVAGNCKDINGLKGDLWVSVGAMGSINMKPKAHLARQLKRNLWL